MAAMYVEDLFLRIRNHLLLTASPLSKFANSSSFLRTEINFRGILEDWSLGFIENVGNHLDYGRTLSVKQAAQALKIIERLRSRIVMLGWASDDQIATMLAAPSYKQPLYEATYVPREVRYLGGNLIAFRFKGDRELIEKITALSTASLTPWLHGEVSPHLPSWQREQAATVAIKTRYDYLYKIKIVPVYRFNIKAITDIIATHRFKTDDTILEYLRGARKNMNEPTVVSVSAEDEVILIKVNDDPILSSWITQVGEGVAI